ncbi:MAG: hypothetical protein ONB46_17620 [candidate division KSB1 bacterium]|nr:hypothetical protein [candidate division KSB1 bacterium]MDZ7367576.1 hypothetical protein [candidate division KSB1 bacterium]MDZ7405368.1 hypothetical protein [candidate division KSB1 bacterium]
MEIHDVAEFEYANGQSDEALLCYAQVKWHGQWQKIEVALSADNEPAIGTRLLNGCVMMMNFIDNTLTIDKPLPQ